MRPDFENSLILIRYQANYLDYPSDHPQFHKGSWNYPSDQVTITRCSRYTDEIYLQGHGHARLGRYQRKCSAGVAWEGPSVFIYINFATIIPCSWCFLANWSHWCRQYRTCNDRSQDCMVVFGKQCQLTSLFLLHECDTYSIEESFTKLHTSYDDDDDVFTFFHIDSFATSPHIYLIATFPPEGWAVFPTKNAQSDDILLLCREFLRDFCVIYIRQKVTILSVLPESYYTILCP